MANPGSVISRYATDFGIPAAVGVPALAFAVFFLQMALDLDQSGKMGPFIGGAIVGGLTIPFLALLVWGVTRPFGEKKTLRWTVQAFGLAYAPAVVYGVCGLAANVLLGWHTTVAFCVTGVLWTLSPLFATLRQMTGDRRRLSMVLATMVGLVVLVVWTAVVGG